MAANKPVPKQGAIAVSVEEIETYDLFKDNAFSYGILTLEDRALPDFRDGMLKVSRRVLWAMHNIAKANGPFVKTARIVGEAMGKYHPHGDQAIQAAIETMVWSPLATADGSGNWGSQTDKCAAMRYTDMRMSQYADKFLVNKDFMATVNYHPNYDGKDKEPELMPALLPNLILNGSFGIAVGLSSHVPSFHKNGVVKLLRGMLAGRKLTTKACLTNLEVVFPFGGHVPKEDWQIERLTALFETGKASLYAYCDHLFDHRAKTLHITGIPPRMNPETLMDKLRGTEYFVSVQDQMGKQSITPSDIMCVFKKTVNTKDAAEELYNSTLFVTLPFQMAMVERYYDEQAHRIKAHIYQWGVITFLENWLQYRKDLEARMLVCKAQAINDEIQRKGWLLLAQEQRKTVASSWEADDQKAFIRLKLKVPDEGAVYIIGLRLSQLAKLDRDRLNAEVAELNKQLKRVVHLQANIEESILQSLP